MKKRIKLLLICSFTVLLFFAGINKSEKTSKILNNNRLDNLKRDFELKNCLKAGSPFLVNFSMEGIVDKQVWSIEQDTNNVMLFANRRGIITFDGKDWKYLNIPSIPYKLKKEPTSQKIFVGCNNGIGYLEKFDGEYEYKSIDFDDTEIEEITNIVYNSKYVYFYNENSIIRVNINNLEDKFIIPNNKLKFSGIFIYNDTAYVSVKNKGIYEIKNEFISPNLKCNKKDNSEILFYIEKSDNEVLIGTDDNKIYIFDGEELNHFETDAESFFEENYIITGNKIDDEKFAVGTLDGGIVIIDSKNGNTINIINNSSGLPDNEIYTLNKDNFGGLWISHIFGVSRIDFEIPIKNYSNYYGIKGNIISTSLLDSVLYVVSSEGVFYLTQPKDINELNNLKKLIVKEIEEVKSTTYEEIFQESEVQDFNVEINNEVNSNEENEEENKGFFKKWRDKRNKKNNDQEAENETEENETEKNEETENFEIENSDINENISDTISTHTKDIDIQENNTYNNNTYTYVIEEETEKKEDITLKFNYYFKKIDGLNDKCKQVEIFENSLLIATNNGLFQLSDENNLKNIISEKYITMIYKSIQKSGFYILSANSIDYISFQNANWKIVNIELENNNILKNINSITEDEAGNLWLGSEDIAYQIISNDNFQVAEIKDYQFNTSFAEKIIVKNIYNKIYLFLTEGIYFYDEDNQKIENEISFDKNEKNTLKYISSQNEIIWYLKENEWFYQDNTLSVEKNQTEFLNIFENIRDIKLDSKGNFWIATGYKSLYKINTPDTSNRIHKNFKLNISKIYSDSIIYKLEKQIILNHDNDGIYIDYSAPCYLKEASNQYQYIVEGLMHNWSDWTDEQTIKLYLKSGKYKIYIRAKNIIGQISNEEIISINVKPPFWETPVFYILLAFVLSVLVGGFFRIRQKALNKRNEFLEQKVKERTAEINMKNEELMAQKEELQSQKEEIEAQRDEIQNHYNITTKQKEMIEFQNKQITDSIEYAKRIQNAILPLKDALGTFFSEFFIINMPRDVVSGDFYFIKSIEDKIIVAVADCTGHGVPGAFLSMMGVAYLNEIVTKTEKFYANEILNTLRKNIIDSLHQSQESDRKDGMDISLCVFDKNQKEVQFAGAYNPLFIFRDNDIIEITADKMPIGYHVKKDIAFTSKVMQYKENDIFYLFSDGYMDQFGGQHGRKFLKGNFKKLLSTLGELTLEDQKEIILKTYFDWKGDFEQIDDVMVLSVKI